MTGLSKQIFYVAFMDASDVRPIMRPFVRKGFSHVLIFFDLGSVVIMLEPCFHRLEIRQIYNKSKTGKEFSAAEFACLWHSQGINILKYESPFVDPSIFFPHTGRIVLSCVSVVAYTLGIHGFILTPWGLYKKLIKAGAFELTSTWCNLTMGMVAMGSKPKKPDNSRQIAELDRQRKEAEARASEMAQENLDDINALRRRRRGRASLIRTQGGELGVNEKLGG